MSHKEPWCFDILDNTRSTHQVPEHHGTVHPSVGMLPVKVLVHFGLSLDVLSGIPVFRKVIPAAQVLNDGHTERVHQ